MSESWGDFFFPRALHSLFLCTFGFQLFSLSIFTLHRWGIDVALLLASGWETDKMYRECRRLADSLWGIYVLAILLCALPLVPSSLVALAAWTAVLLLVLLPLDCYGRAGRSLFRESLLRTVSPWDWRSPTRFIDIVLGDVLTSYAKVLAECDMLLFLYVLPAGSAGRSKDLAGDPMAVDAPTMYVPTIWSVLLVCYPYFCRFRQCVADYCYGGRGRALLNALKYATSFPLVYTAYRMTRDDSWRPLWLFLSTINTIYTSSWDLYIDWELNPRRKISLLPGWAFAVAGLLNCALRASWLLLLLDRGGPQATVASPTGMFLLQALEIGRRFIWLVFRMESQQLNLHLGQQTQPGFDPLPLEELYSVVPG